MQQVQQMHQLKTERLGQMHAASEEEFDEIIWKNNVEQFGINSFDACNQ